MAEAIPGPGRSVAADEDVVLRGIADGTQNLALARPLARIRRRSSTERPAAAATRSTARTSAGTCASRAASRSRSLGGSASPWPRRCHEASSSSAKSGLPSLSDQMRSPAAASGCRPRMAGSAGDGSTRRSAAAARSARRCCCGRARPAAGAPAPCPLPLRDGPRRCSAAWPLDVRPCARKASSSRLARSIHCTSSMTKAVGCSAAMRSATRRKAS